MTVPTLGLAKPVPDCSGREEEGDILTLDEMGGTATVGRVVGGDMISVFGEIPEVVGRTSLTAGDEPDPESISCRRRRSSGESRETDLAISSKREGSESTPTFTGVHRRSGGDDSNGPEEAFDGVLGDVFIVGRLL